MIDFTEDTEPAQELEVATPAGELEAALPPIEPGLQVLMRDSDSGTILTVEKVDKTVVLSQFRRVDKFRMKLKDFWVVYKPLGSIKKALELQPAVEVGLRVRYRGSINEGTVSSVLQDYAWIKGLVGKHYLSDFWREFELVEDPKAPGPDRSKLPRLLEIAGELTQIAKLIEELSLGYGSTDEGKIAAYSSQVFRTLTERREELRSELVALG